jgi:Uma2 family endonuclease
LNIIGEKKIQGAPDLVIEILSENTAYRDFVQKKKLYARFGVKEYSMVILGISRGLYFKG